MCPVVENGRHPQALRLLAAGLALDSPAPQIVQIYCIPRREMIYFTT